jgi:pimeloyl-ACP methyl ester carboxylesterase
MLSRLGFKFGLVFILVVMVMNVGGGSVLAGGSEIGRVKSFDGIEIAYMARGAGEVALVFIHGGFADKSFWKNQVELFAKKYRVIALDLGGHGESGKNRTKWGLGSFGEDVRAVVEKEKVKKVVLIGNSLGGPVAVEAARLIGEKAIGVVGVDTFQDMTQTIPPGYFKKQAQAFRTDFNGTMKQMVQSLFHKDHDPVLYAEVEKKMMNNSAEMAAQMMESFEGFDYVGLVRDSKIPIRCIDGDLYPIQVEKNRGIHPDFDAVIIEKSGHYPMLEKPELFNIKLEEVVQGLLKGLHPRHL